jgi:aminocarboxymuconate-semialdehyde decarboxylase
VFFIIYYTPWKSSHTLTHRLSMCVFVHPWEMCGEEKMTKYWYIIKRPVIHHLSHSKFTHTHTHTHSRLPWLVAMPSDTSFAICSVIFGGVMERLPSLRLCFAHGGGSFPYTLGRVSLLRERGRERENIFFCAYLALLT